MVALVESRDNLGTISTNALPHNISLQAAMEIPREDDVWRQELLVATGCAITAPDAFVCNDGCSELQEEYDVEMSLDSLLPLFPPELTFA